jgi:hypothetical protein
MYQCIYELSMGEVHGNLREGAQLPSKSGVVSCNNLRFTVLA